MRSNITSKACRSLIGIIEAEGARVLDTEHRRNHMRITYTFNGTDLFTQTLPRHASVGDRWEKNFRAAIRRNKPRGNRP